MTDVDVVVGGGVVVVAVVVVVVDVFVLLDKLLFMFLQAVQKELCFPTRTSSPARARASTSSAGTRRTTATS